MISREEVEELRYSKETARVERTISTSDMDKFQEAICAFSNDMSNSRKPGYLLIGVHDNGALSDLKVDDKLFKKISGIRSDGNILPLPVMTTEVFEFEGGDVLVVEVQPSFYTPVRYRGRTFIRIGPRRDIASEAEERILAERSCSYMATFDATPCRNAKLEDLDLDYIRNQYLPMVFDEETLKEDNRDIKDQLASLHLYNRDHDCPTYASIILFGKNPRYFLLGNYVQFVRFKGENKGGKVLNEREFSGPLCKLLPKLESFVRDAIITQRPVPETLFREKTVWNYPEGAIRELVMNACMHRDFQSNMPIRLYQFDDYIEVMNPGGLYGEARPENFPTVNDYRNPLVAEAMKVMKYVNKFNRGIAKVQEMLKENGNPPAKFDVDTLTAFRVVVEATTEKVPVNDPANRDIIGGENGGINAEERKNEVENDHLNDHVNDHVDSLSKFSKKVFEELKKDNTLTYNDIKKMLGGSIPTIRRAMKELKDKQLIKREGSDKTGKWVILK